MWAALVLAFASLMIVACGDGSGRPGADSTAPAAGNGTAAVYFDDLSVAY